MAAEIVLILSFSLKDLIAEAYLAAVKGCGKGRVIQLRESVRRRYHGRADGQIFVILNSEMA